MLVYQTEREQEAAVLQQATSSLKIEKVGLTGNYRYGERLTTVILKKNLVYTNRTTKRKATIKKGTRLEMTTDQAYGPGSFTTHFLYPEGVYNLSECVSSFEGGGVGNYKHLKVVAEKNHTKEQTISLLAFYAVSAMLVYATNLDCRSKVVYANITDARKHYDKLGITIETWE